MRMKPSAEPAAAGQTIGRYVILSLLGSGGMGVVYAAYDPVLDRKIALKLLHDGEDGSGATTDGRARMQREAQALARLSHPNVIAVHDVGEHEGAMYIAMEIVVGGTLVEWQRGKPWRQILDAYIAAARGLAAAHRAELVHRDFKPENVLVGDDGRVRVTDFGLARLSSATPEVRPPHATPTTALASDLTAAGSVMGTPSYMAPEQIKGERVDARSDQFSWCLALWEALYGEQPWPRENLAVRAAAIEADPPRAPAATEVPRALARVLTRGLSPDSAVRYATIDALLADVERVTKNRRAHVAIALAGTIAIAGVATAVMMRGGSSTTTCDAAILPVAEVWTQATRDRVRTKFTATGAAFAGDSFASLDRAVTGWLERWRGVAVESCRATRNAGTQTVATLDLRTACLARRRDDVVSLVAAFARADRDLVERAPNLALPDLESCSDIAVLAGTAPAPTDPKLADQRLGIETELAAVETELLPGVAIARAKALTEVVDKLVARATTLGWTPLVAHARRARADLARELGDGKAARLGLIDAAAAASAGGDTDQLTALYIELVDVESRLTSDYALADSWAALADGTLARLGPRPDKRLWLSKLQIRNAQRAGHFETARDLAKAALALAEARGPMAELDVLALLGVVEGDLNELSSAETHLARAHELARAEVGVQHPRYATIAHDLGTIAFRRGRYAEAEKLFRTALAINEANPDELATARTIQGLGVAVLSAGRVDEARQLFERALDMHVRRLGPDHPDVANALNDIGGAYHQAGEFQRELEINLRALAIRERALGPDHPDVGQSLVNVAIASKALDQWATVFPSYRRAIAIFEKAHGANHAMTAIARLNYAEALRVHGMLDDAATQYELARTALAGQLGDDHPVLAHVYNGTGQLELARGHTALAIPQLERAVKMREADPGDAAALAESRFALARALGRTDRAKSLAQAAADGFRGAGKNFAKQLAEVEAWLK
jgi:eukaryotic-like serine/threonine-protein kinase